MLKKVKKSVKNRVFHTFHRVFHMGVETFPKWDVENSSFSNSLFLTKMRKYLKVSKTEYTVILTCFKRGSKGEIGVI